MIEPRKYATKAQKAAALARQGGLCGCGCGEPLGAQYDWDHILARGLTGTNEDHNWAAVTRSHHRIKTKRDLGMIAKAKRQSKSALPRPPEERKPSTLKSHPWPPRGTRKLRSRGFEKRPAA